MKLNVRLLLCAVAVGVLGGIVSCARLTLQEEPTTVRGTTMAGYPDIQATINASLDRVLAVVDSAAAQNAQRDPRYATLRRELQRERDGERVTERALNPNSSDEILEDEQKEIDELIAENPELAAAFAKLAEELESAYAGIATIEITVQNLDKNDRPVGEPATIRSKDGVIDFGYQALTVHEYLLWIQSQAYNSERGFIIDVDYYRHGFHPDYADGRPWPGDRVNYFFDSTISPEDVIWMRDKLHRTWHATGVVFQEYSDSDRRRSDWQRGRGGYLRISRAQLGSTPGIASVGKVDSSFLTMDVDLPRDETGEALFYHEIGHVLGLLHEHQRYDRDENVRVNRSGTAYDRIPQWRNERHCFLWGNCSGWQAGFEAGWDHRAALEDRNQSIDHGQAVLADRGDIGSGPAERLGAVSAAESA